MALNIFITIIVLIILILVFVWYLSNRNESNLAQIQEEIDYLKVEDLKSLINELQVIHFTGASLKSFEHQNNVYNEIVEKKIPHLELELSDTQVKNSQFKVFNARKNIKLKFNDLNKIKDDLEESYKELSKLSESTKINASQSIDLQKKYQETRKKLLTKSFVYGPTVPHLESDLKKIEEEFSTEKELTENGDHLEAKSLLEDIKKNMSRINTRMGKTEPLYQELIDIFPGQLEEIETVYENMKNQKYDFSEPNIEDESMKITDKIADSKEKLAGFDFDSVVEDNKKISIQIDTLYDRLEKEVIAKNEVIKISDSVFDFLQHAQKQNESLGSIINDANNHYVLSNGEKEKSSEYKNNIYDLIEQFNNYSEEMSTDSVIYTEILKFYNSTKTKLENIEKEQNKIYSFINDMIESEKIAKKNVNEFNSNLKKQKLKIDQLRLRGLPKDYLEYYNMVGSEIIRLSDQLSKDKVNIDDVSKQLIIVQEDLNNLEQQTDELVSNIKLTEVVIQYSNRYINDNEDVRSASQLSKKLFDQEFDYKKSLEVISNCLEKVEPGSIERLKSSIDA